jgi:hypothetical protein
MLIPPPAHRLESTCYHNADMSFSRGNLPLLLSSPLHTQVFAGSPSESAIRGYCCQALVTPGDSNLVFNLHTAHWDIWQVGPLFCMSTHWARGCHPCPLCQVRETHHDPIRDLHPAGAKGFGHGGHPCPVSQVRDTHHLL